MLENPGDSHVVARNDAAVALLDVSAVSPGHTLVIPRTHAEYIWDLDDETAAGLMLTVRSVARLLRDRLHPDGLTVRQNNGAASGQRIPHVHVHLVPRWVGDGHIGWPQARLEPVDNAEVIRILGGQPRLPG